MRLAIYMQKTSNLFAENRLLKVCLLILVLITVYNSVMISRALSYTRTIVLPANMDRKIEFIEGKPTDEYVALVGRDLASLGLSFSPANARGQFAALLKYYSPAAYPEGYKMWYTLASRIEDAKVSQAFYLRDIKINISTNEIELIGEKKQHTDDKIVKTDEFAKYIINYQITDGKFEVLTFLDKSQTKEKGYEEMKQDLENKQAPENKQDPESKK